MIDIGDKKVVRRTATAEGVLLLKESTIGTIVSGSVKKGDVLAASKLAGIQGAKATSTILPLCHQIPLTSIIVEIEPKKDRLLCRCTVTADYKTGVEMEALVGVTTALLNAWDMVKYLEKNKMGQYPETRIVDIRVLRKHKGG
ncbi:MAG: molybdenum cofactor biosynthesis protein MoaC [Euryarchaeota archaeon RBG_13_57_23]|nr:MAG: molybdenum cofactor biosynthesis protein MoaC [Euryarchaeota archaeon RBG_13_57_23]